MARCLSLVLGTLTWGSGSALRAEVLGFRVWGFGLWAWVYTEFWGELGLGFRVRGLGFRV